MSISEKIQAKLSERVNKEFGYRGDLFLADHKTVTANSAKVLIGYDKALGRPTGDDLRNFMVKMFDGKVTADMTTAKVHDVESGVSVVAHLYRPTRKLEENNSMVTVVANVRYMDTEMNETWEVSQGQDGTKYLSRVCSENIDEILQARRDKMQIKATKLCLANVLSSGNEIVNVGDIVKCVIDDKVHADVKVTAVNGDTLKVKSAGAFYSIPKDAIIEIEKPSEQEKSAERKKLQDYYKDAYGFDDFAKNLTEDYGKHDKE